MCWKYRSIIVKVWWIITIWCSNLLTSATIAFDWYASYNRYQNREFEKVSIMHKCYYHCRWEMLNTTSEPRLAHDILKLKVIAFTSLQLNQICDFSNRNSFWDTPIKWKSKWHPHGINCSMDSAAILCKGWSFWCLW